jgi:hypothetical protein
MVRKSRRATSVFYPIQVRLRYEMDNELPGHSRTVSLSREIVRFECEEPLPVGMPIRLILMWPAALPDGTPLNLWISGKIDRNLPHQVEVRVISYEFRTRPGMRHAAASMSQDPRETDTSRLVVTLGLRP